jgi:hypothetical protein
MSSTIFVNCSPDSNAPHDGGSGDQDANSPVHQTQTGRWEKFCPDCEEWIGLGLRGGEWSFIMHQGGKRCRQIKQRKAQIAANEELLRSFGIYASPTSPIVEASSSPATTKPPPPLPSHKSTDIKPPSPHVLPVTTSSVTHPPQLPCTGIRYKWELGNVCKTYPFQYHETGTPTWFVGIGVPSPNGDIIELQSHECTRFRDPSMEACLSCTNVPTSREFKNVLRLASKDPSPNSAYIYLSWAQLEKRLRGVNHDMKRIRREVKCFYIYLRKWKRTV